MAMVSFRKGAEIEVSGTEDGFVGAWCAATVVRSTPKTGLISVEYQAFSSNDVGSRPLKKTVHLSHLRPRPPPDGSDRVFELNDEVDALCNGWWLVGTIKRVLKSSRFLVLLSNNREEMAFGRSELRVHRDWIGGRWISTDEQRKLEQEFGNGTPVEVTSDEEGFEGAWFNATIVKAVGKNKFLVEYQNLRTDDEIELLRETVYSQYIRPVPPDIPEVNSFRLLEEVDALYNDGWWVGVISKVLKDSRYIVYFRQTKEEMDFSHSELRFHQDWINGKWVRVSQELKL